VRALGANVLAFASDFIAFLLLLILLFALAWSVWSLSVLAGVVRPVAAANGTNSRKRFLNKTLRWGFLLVGARSLWLALVVLMTWSGPEGDALILADVPSVAAHLALRRSIENASDPVFFVVGTFVWFCLGCCAGASIWVTRYFKDRRQRMQLSA
jgi:hypothetical protein